MKMITYGQVLAELETLVREVGNDYRYQPPSDSMHPNRPMCYYVHDAGGGSLTPGCIVGTWAHRFHRVALETLQEFEGKSAQGLLLSLRDRGILSVDPHGVFLLLAVQKAQDGWDGGQPVRTWRESLTQARALVPPPTVVPV